MNKHHEGMNAAALAVRQFLDNYEADNSSTADSILTLVTSAINNENVTAAWQSQPDIQKSTETQSQKIVIGCLEMLRIFKPVFIAYPDSIGVNAKLLSIFHVTFYNS